MLVTEAEIAEAMRFLYGRAKLACEPAGAVAVAALLAGKVSGGTVCCVVSGGNVSPETASSVLNPNGGLKSIHAAQANAPTPVMSRPTIRVCIVSVPS